MTPIPAPADRRFRRAHVTPARRTRFLRVSPWKAARTAALIALGLYIGYQVIRDVITADALMITRITVSGNSRLSKGEVVALLDGIRGSNMLTVDIDTWRQKLLSSPWVADAAIRRVLPGTVAVAISERQPMGIGRIDDDLYLLDDRGGIIDQYGPNYAEFDLPVIDGLAGPPRDDSPIIDGPRAAFASRILASLQAHPSLSRRVSEIDVSDIRDAVLILKGDTAMVRVGSEQFAERLQSYIDLAPALRERIAAIDYVDLRFDERVYVRPAARASGRRGPVGPGR